MPGESTQQIVPCSRIDDHEPHPVVGVDTGGDGWCPGMPRRHPDGSLVAAEPAEVPLAGELRALTDDIRQAQAAEIRSSVALQAETYTVVIDGIECRVIRRALRNDPLRAYRPGEPQGWWDAHIDGAAAVETMVSGEHGRCEVKPISLSARFVFTPGDFETEQVALERAGDYCEMAARVLVTLRRAQQQTYEAAVAELSRARTVNLAHPDE